MRSPVGKVKVSIEVFLHPGIGIPLEAPEGILIGKARRCDAGARRIAAQILHFFLIEPAIDGLKFVIPVFAHLKCWPSVPALMISSFESPDQHPVWKLCLLCAEAAIFSANKCAGH